jgi:hypothetical protein
MPNTCSPVQVLFGDIYADAAEFVKLFSVQVYLWRLKDAPPDLACRASGFEGKASWFKVPVHGTIVQLGDFAGTVPCVPAMGATCGLLLQNILMDNMIGVTFCNL